MQRSYLIAAVLGSTTVSYGWAQTAVSVPVGANTESMNSAPELGALGYSISIDNQAIAGAPPPRVADRIADLQAAEADIQVRFDGLETTRRLNVSTQDMRSAFSSGETVTFRSSMNYPGYVARTEVRILDRSKWGRPVVATVPIGPNGTADWVMPRSGSTQYSYVLRTYDAQGRFDETQPLPLLRTNRDIAQSAAGPYDAPGEGDDRTALRRIPVHGGTVTVSGTNIRPGGAVQINGEKVPVDAQGRFAVTRIMPSGDRVVDVDVDGKRYRRDVNIPSSDWFKVGIFDVTAGVRQGDAIDGTEQYINGRAALYVTGKTDSGWQVTGSFDTGDGPIDNIFQRLNDKGTGEVLDRLRANDDDLYLTYGDDSTSFDDTPSQGRVYLRVENDTTRFTWGDFKAGLNDGGLISNTRDLYGAELSYRSADVTPMGDPRWSAQAYAARPDTVVQRDVLRGTGGSVYFLRRQDLTTGSLSLSLQTIDPDTGRVISSATLIEGTDYRVDHLQGVLILSQPVGSSASGQGLITNAGSTFEQTLVAQYEYTPTTGLDGATAVGGRAEAWAGDKLRFGATLMRDDSAGDDQTLSGVDLRYQATENSFAELELAQADGPGLTRSSSVDGGLTLTSTGGASSGRALAFSLNGQVTLKDIGFDRDGAVRFYAERLEAGFSTVSQDIAADQALFGIEGDVAINNRLSFSGSIESFDKTGLEEKLTAEATLSYALTQDWGVKLGVAFLDQSISTAPDQSGTRTDVAVRLDYKGLDAADLYAFGQGTLSRTGGLSSNTRFGAGLSAQLSDRLSATSEVSGGDGGVAGAFRLSYAQSASSSYYFGYDLQTPNGANAVHSAAENGTVVLGGKTQNTSSLSTFVETKTDLPAPRQAITNAFGVTYTPTDRLTLGGTFETGIVRDDSAGDFKRNAVSVALGFADTDKQTANLRLEYRDEDGDGDAQDRVTYGLSANYTNKLNEDWRFVAGLDALYSQSAQDTFRDGEYARLRLGYAYRPIDNEKLNVLLGYTFLNDLPGEDQVDLNGNTDGPQQRSHIFSISANYDLNPKLTVGGKLGYRSSEIADRGTNDFDSNTAALAIARVDWHVIHEWDISAEGRMLHTRETNIDETGALIGVYRHIGNNAKVGVGYEWGDVSDDLADASYQNQGMFLNIISKF